MYYYLTANSTMENTSLNNGFYFNTMSQDEIDEQIYQSIRNNYAAETLVLLSRMTIIQYQIYCVFTLNKKAKNRVEYTLNGKQS